MFSAGIMQVALLLLLAVACVEQRGGAGTRGCTEVQIMENKIGGAVERERRYDPKAILVRFRDGTDERTIDAIQKEEELETIRVVSSPSLYLMKIVGGASVEETVQRLMRHGEVIFAEPNYVRRIE